MICAERSAASGARSSKCRFQAFDVRILPGTRRREDHFGDTHHQQSALEDVVVDAVPIAVQPPGRAARTSAGQRHGIRTGRVRRQLIHITVSTRWATLLLPVIIAIPALSVSAHAVPGPVTLFAVWEASVGDLNGDGDTLFRHSSSRMPAGVRIGALTLLLLVVLTLSVRDVSLYRILLDFVPAIRGFRGVTRISLVFSFFAALCVCWLLSFGFSSFRTFRRVPAQVGLVVFLWLFSTWEAGVNLSELVEGRRAREGREDRVRCPGTNASRRNPGLAPNEPGGTVVPRSNRRHARRPGTRHPDNERIQPGIPAGLQRTADTMCGRSLDGARVRTVCSGFQVRGDPKPGAGESVAAGLLTCMGADRSSSAHWRSCGAVGLRGVVRHSVFELPNACRRDDAIRGCREQHLRDRVAAAAAGTQRQAGARG